MFSGDESGRSTITVVATETGESGVSLANTTVGEVNAMPLSQQVDAIRSREDLSTFLDNWLCRADAYTTIARVPHEESVLDALAWCLGELDDLFAARGGRVPPEPT